MSRKSLAGLIGVSGKRRRQLIIWSVLFAGGTLMLSIFHAGFFFYALMVVAFLFLLDMLTATVGLLGIHMERSLTQLEVNLGQVVDGNLTVINGKNFPAPWLFWHDSVDAALDVEGSLAFFRGIGAGKEVKGEFRLHSTRRGFFRIGPLMLESSGPLGLIRRYLVSSTLDFITVFPRVVKIENALPSGRQPVHQVPRRHSLFEDPSRFLGLRDYRPGDSMRRIHWKATARSSRIQVKLFEPSTLTGAFLVLDMGLAAYPVTRSQPGVIDPLLELTVTTTASLVEYILAADQPVGLLSNGNDGAERYSQHWQGGTFSRLSQAVDQSQLSKDINAFVPVELSSAKGYHQRYQLMTALARLVPSASLTLADLLNMEIPRLPRSLALIIITPIVNEALISTLRALRISGIDPTVIGITLSREVSFPDARQLPRNIPFRVVSCEEDITRLGVNSL